MLSAIDRNHCPQSIGTPVRNRRNPHFNSLPIAKREPEEGIDCSPVLEL
jgi:hypothetical protein